MKSGIGLTKDIRRSLLIDHLMLLMRIYNTLMMDVPPYAVFLIIGGFCMGHHEEYLCRMEYYMSF